jgi:DNA-binding MarR family transcriptional regulator
MRCRRLPYEALDVCQDDGFASGWEVMTAARRSQHRLEVFMDEALEHLGMTFAQDRALEVLAGQHELHVSELARALRISRQGAMKTVKKLDRGALIETTPEAGRLYVRPSVLGERRLAQCRHFTHDLKAQLEERLTHGELHRLRLLLERAGEALLPSRPTGPEWWLAP